MNTGIRMSIPTSIERAASAAQAEGKDAARNLFRLIQFSDSAFPIGTFSFSNGLETAAHLGIVHDAATLAEYARSAAWQAATSDAVAALHAFRGATASDYAAILRADRQIYNFRLNDEGRLMLCRMGKKLAELAADLLEKDSLFEKWLADINGGVTPGAFPVSQGIAFARLGLSERELFVSHQYGVINMALSAALRCVRVSHYDTQKILFDLSREIDAAFDEARGMTFDDMRSFVPQMDLFASLHEKGSMRMFMN